MSRRIFSPSCIFNNAFVSFINKDFKIIDYEKDMIVHVPDGEVKPEFIINTRFGYRIKSVSIVDNNTEEVIQYLIPQDKNGIPIFSFDMPDKDIKINIDIREMEQNKFCINYLEKNHITELYNDYKKYVYISLEKINELSITNRSPLLSNRCETFASPGERVCINIDITKGYALRSLSVINDRTMLPIETLEPTANNNFIFTMPNDNVTIICQTFRIDDYKNPEIGKDITIRSSFIECKHDKPIILKSLYGIYKYSGYSSNCLNQSPILRIGEKRVLELDIKEGYKLKYFKIFTCCNNHKGQINYNVTYLDGNEIKLEIIVPDCNILFDVEVEEKEKDEMENKVIETENESIKTDGAIATFKIPEELAKELSELLTKQSIRQNMLKEILISNPSKYEEVEKLLIPITTRIETIKTKITTEYVPDYYRDDKYMWNYDGYDISGTTVSVFEN